MRRTGSEPTVPCFSCLEGRPPDLEALVRALIEDASPELGVERAEIARAA